MTPPPLFLSLYLSTLALSRSSLILGAGSHWTHLRLSYSPFTSITPPFSCYLKSTIQNLSLFLITLKIGSQPGALGSEFISFYIFIRISIRPYFTFCFEYRIVMPPQHKLVFLFSLRDLEPCNDS